MICCKRPKTTTVTDVKGIPRESSVPPLLIPSQARQTRIQDSKWCRLYFTTSHSISPSHFSKKHTESTQRSTDYFWNKRFESLQSSQLRACRLCPFLYCLSVIYFHRITESQN